jgi:hypothetical protein
MMFQNSDEAPDIGMELLQGMESPTNESLLLQVGGLIRIK